MKKRGFFLLTGIILTSACSIKVGSEGGKDEGSQESSKAPATPGSRNTYGTVNGKPADQYYAQFYYKKETDAEGRPRYRYLMANLLTRISKDESSALYFNGNLYLKEDGSYRFDYSEIVDQDLSDDVIGGPPHGQKVVQGKWKIEGTELVLTDLGKTSGMKYQEADAITLQFEKDILSPGLRGKYVFMTYGRSTSGIEE